MSFDRCPCCHRIDTIEEAFCGACLAEHGADTALLIARVRVEADFAQETVASASPTLLRTLVRVVGPAVLQKGPVPARPAAGPGLASTRTAGVGRRRHVG